MKCELHFRDGLPQLFINPETAVEASLLHHIFNEQLLDRVVMGEGLEDGVGSRIYLLVKKEEA